MNLITRAWRGIAMTEKRKKEYFQFEWQWQTWRLKSSGKSNIKIRTKDHAFDDYMEVCKKVRKVLKFQSMILAQPEQSICVARLDTLGRRLGLKMYESGRFVLKFPHIFEIFEHPVQRLLWCRLTPKAMAQIEEERAALTAQEEKSVTRLQKLIMMAAGGRIRLEHIYHARKDLGLPDDLEVSIILKYPRYFRLTCPDLKDKDGLMKYVELVERDPGLAVCAIEKVREKEYRGQGSRREEDTRGAQQPTEPTFPNISAQSWYPPSVLSPFAETGYRPLPNNLIPADSNSFQKEVAVTNTSPASQPQSPSYSDLSPETGGIIFSLLRDKREDELRTIFIDKDAYNKVLHSIGEVKHLESLRDDLCMKTAQLARKNIENANQVAELRNQCAIIRTTELAVAEEKIHELEKQEQELFSLSPVALLENLRDAANMTDEESENLNRLLTSGEIELSDFIQNYRKMRTIYHTRILLRSAGMAGMSP